MLNLKGIPYKTQWVEYPDVAPTFKSFQIQPNDDGTPYTIPTIKIGPDEYVMDSLKIAADLERLHPSPPLHLDSPLLPKVQQLVMQVMVSLRGVVMPKIPRNLLNPPSAEYFDRTRSAKFGMSLPQLEKEIGGDGAWGGAEPAIKELGAMLRAEGGPFVLGKTVSDISESFFSKLCIVLGYNTCYLIDCFLATHTP